VEQFDAASIKYADQLVVDGMITNEFKQHRVSISHTLPLNTLEFSPEQGATVSVSENGGLTIPLTETSPGIYMTPPFAGTIGNKYSLRFQTAAGKSYTSNAVEMKPVPPIDRIYAVYPVIQNGEQGVQLFLDGGDGGKRTNYYRWEYEETYEIQTPFPSKFVWLGGNEITFRLQQVNNCWATKKSNAILSSKTTGLSADRVVGLPFRFIPSVSQELVIKYSVNVTQYALNEESYTYWQKLKEINENQGTLYDKQPGNLRGNVSAVSNSEEIVSGFFSASAVSTRRVFFTPKDFESKGFVPAEYLKSCSESPPISVPIEKLGATLGPAQASFIIYDATGPGPNVVLLLRKACCDCTSQGTNIRPPFWQ
ncbi:MAG TPA: DUF4249 domain-containing protein, partial [Cyclobacteriaceae bacterium]|nr:DUF4249 domain-containing protein [Cyclobacteriaceae bacterium]